MIRPEFRLLPLLFVAIGCVPLDRSLELGDPFHHVLFKKEGEPGSGPLHVYIEGDGRPFSTRNSVARDPTSPHPIMLDLMRRDPAGGIYVGRPCYHGLAELPECHYRYWTTARYGNAVLTSMTHVIQQSADDRSLVLIGHSGGGTVALLLARRLTNVAAVVTLSGNLDVAGWARHHGYTPLAESDDPAAQMQAPAAVLQLHAVAGRDAVVPANLTQGLRDRLPEGSICGLPRFDHTCCWARHWAAVVGAVDDAVRNGSQSLQGACQHF